MAVAKTPAIQLQIKVADEVFIATALLHREYPDRADFTVKEIVSRVQREGLCEELRPGVHTHASMHCVANRPPNPARLCMLYSTGMHTRRLLLADDDRHPQRDGKLFPEPGDVPDRYRELIAWAKRRYESGSGSKTKWLEGIKQMRGTGNAIWRGEDPDAYVRELRKDWD